MKRGVVFIFILWFSITCTFGQDDVSFKRYSQENGMPAVTLRNLFEDGQGFLWITTEQGITRFDGYTFKTFRHDEKDPNSILNNKVSIFLCDSSRNPIFLSDNAISIYDTKKQIFKNYSNTNIINTSGHNLNINVSKNDYNNNLCWLLKRDMLYKFNPVNGKIDTYKIPNPPINFTDILFTSDTTLLLVSTDPPQIYNFNIKNSKFTLNTNKDLAKACQLNGAFMYNISDGEFTNVKTSPTIIYMGDRFFIFNRNEPSNPVSYVPKHNNKEYKFMRFNLIGDEIWVTTNTGNIISIHIKSGTEKVYNVNVKNLSLGKEEIIYDVLKDEEGEVWGVTDGLGLIRINPINNKVTQYIYEVNNPNSIWSNSCSHILQHSSGVIWIGFVSKGLIKIEKQKKLFKRYIPLNPTAKAVASGRQHSSDVRAILAIDKNKLLVGSLTNLCEVNTLTGENDFAYYKNKQAVVPKLNEKGFYTGLIKDKKGNIIVGTWNRSYFAYNPSTDFFKEYSKNTGYSLLGMGDQTRALLIDSKNNLWVATDSTVAYINVDKFLNATPKNLKFNKFKPELGNPSCITGFPVYCLFEDSKKNIWVGTVSGLNRISPQGKIDQFINNPKDPNSLSENDVRHIIEDDKGNIWIATNGGGINKFNPATNKFISYNTLNGLPDDAIYTIAFDNEKNLWLSSNRGLAKFDPNTGSIKKFSLYDGLQNYEFNTNAVCKMPDGQLVFGGNSGINIFKPSETIINNTAPKIALSSFKIFNKEVPLPFSGITIPYYDNNLTFEFTTLSFYRNEENQYAYKMENFDKDWIYSGTNHTTTYNNLPPGNYVFKIKGSNSAGIWNNEGISYKLIVSPPWWQTWWARILFLIIIASIISFYIRLRTKNLRTQRTILEQKVEERTKELKSTQSLLIQQEKLASLGVLTAGIAHEIKNPLNFVTNFSDLSQKLIEEFKETDSEEDKEDILDDLSKNLLKINKHGHRANSIVENMLQHSRSGKGEVQLTNLNPICEEYLDIAFHNARAKKPGFDCEIRKNFDPSIPKVKVVPQDFSRVMLNFYSNAFDAVKDKPKALVEVSSRLVGNYVELIVRDNGSGIPEHIKESIFQPFFTTKPSGQGTGLGLSISYDIIKAHGGEIKLDSKENEFTEFIIRLPI